MTLMVDVWHALLLDGRKQTQQIDTWQREKERRIVIGKKIIMIEEPNTKHLRRLLSAFLNSV